MKNFSAGVLLALCAAVQGAEVGATLSECARVGKDAQRLACYDKLAGREAAAAAPARTPTQQFGLGKKTEPEVLAAPPPEPDKINATVKAVSSSSRGLQTITLDNEQVWAQQETARAAPLKTGEIVELRRGKLGGYRLFGSSGVGLVIKRVR